MILNYCSVCLSCLSVRMSVIASKREVSTQIGSSLLADSVTPRLPAVGVLLLCDVSKREVSTQPKLTV